MAPGNAEISFCDDYTMDGDTKKAADNLKMSKKAGKEWSTFDLKI